MTARPTFGKCSVDCRVGECHVRDALMRRWTTPEHVTSRAAIH